jgi:YgiT-type zinc finger domain-containing protein
MKCHVCGSAMDEVVTDFPFKLTNTTIVVIKDLPVIQCRNCSEYLIDDAVLERVDYILSRVDAAAELEVIRFAA